MNKDIVDSSGNIFSDLGFSSDEAALLSMRADLMADIRNFIKIKELKQEDVSNMLGISHLRVSDLIKGKWDKFSLEMLIALATRIGMRVSLKTAA